MKEEEDGNGKEQVLVQRQWHLGSMKAVAAMDFHLDSRARARARAKGHVRFDDDDEEEEEEEEVFWERKSWRR